MVVLNVRLFGKLDIRRDGQLLAGFDARKVQELFCYILLNRDSPHPRETLAGLLWGDNSTAQSKRYLRQALWQLQAALKSDGEPGNGRVLLVEPGWLGFNPAADLWLDVAMFEQVFSRVQGVAGQALDAPRVQALCGAVNLYRGDLLEGWFQDWCLYERERLQNMYLAILEKLMDHCEAHEKWEAGLAYGSRILRYDHARERTHQRLMRLYYLSGNRTAALRQYDRCIQALRTELAVRPSARTVALYEQIREERFAGSAGPPSPGAVAPAPASRSGSEALGSLKQLQTMLTEVQGQLQHAIEAVELTVQG